MQTQRIKRCSLTTTEKLRLITEIENGRNKREVAEEFGVGYSTVCGLLKDKMKILILGAAGRDVKRLKAPKFEKVDRATADWFRTMKQKKVTVTGERLRAKAMEFAQEYGITAFAASNGWLTRFKAR